MTADGRESSAVAIGGGGGSPLGDGHMRMQGNRMKRCASARRRHGTKADICTVPLRAAEGRRDLPAEDATLRPQVEAYFNCQLARPAFAWMADLRRATASQLIYSKLHGQLHDGHLVALVLRIERAESFAGAGPVPCWQSRSGIHPYAYGHRREEGLTNSQYAAFFYGKSLGHMRERRHWVDSAMNS
eukprot:363267-Chlamydomonas_euryale.AAC.12